MEAMLYRDDDRRSFVAVSEASTRSGPGPATPPPALISDWQAGLPLLAAAGATLRELRVSDAPVLFALLSTEEVSRFISPPPTTVEGFERFIAWTAQQRMSGDYVCFGIVPAGSTTAIGLIQIRRLGTEWDNAEWGFAIGSPYWGTGLFAAAAKAVLDFAFVRLGVQRLEARAAAANGRGIGALRKLGAVEEATLRRSLRLRGRYVNQVLWTLWRPAPIECKAVWGSRLH